MGPIEVTELRFYKATVPLVDGEIPADLAERPPRRALLGQQCVYDRAPKFKWCGTCRTEQKLHEGTWNHRPCWWCPKCKISIRLREPT